MTFFFSLWHVPRWNPHIDWLLNFPTTQSHITQAKSSDYDRFIYNDISKILFRSSFCNSLSFQLLPRHEIRRLSDLLHCAHFDQRRAILRGQIIQATIHKKLLRVRIQPGAWMSVSCEWVLSRRGLCDGPISHPGESYRACVCVFVIECDQLQQQTSTPYG
jgi:hypothetical protein